MRAEALAMRRAVKHIERAESGRDPDKMDLAKSFVYAEGLRVVGVVGPETLRPEHSSD